MVSFQYHPHRLLLDSIQSTNGSKTYGGGSTSTYAGDGNFDSNMVIILAALLCALICALGLNSIVRCAIRCSNRFVFETPHEASIRLASTGLKKHVLNEIPVVVFGSGLNIIPATECPICLGEFSDGEKVRILPKCNHGFHVKCIDTWLVSRSSCPICRRALCGVSPAKEETEVRPPVNGATEVEEQPSFVVVTVHDVSQ